jgi:hypothetical protein
MDTFGVHSEVGKLRKVMVHRPELSLQRLTPATHDELLFDDVLWVAAAGHAGRPHGRRARPGSAAGMTSPDEIQSTRDDERE